MKTPFPNPLERTVASALLLLSATPPSLSPPPPPPKLCFVDGTLESGSNEKEKESLLSAESNASSSSSLTSDGSSDEIRERQRRIFAVVARCHDFHFKVARKSRTKVCVISDGWKIASGSSAAGPSASESAEVSCLSNSSSAASSARSRYVTGGPPKSTIARDEQKRKQVGSTHMRRKAQAILKLLSGGSSSEVKIRKLLGDSPDTSKALRMLLKLEEVKRYGTGGRHDPYIYKIA